MKRLYFVLLLVVFPLSVLGKIYAVLVGVSEYEYCRINELAHP